MDIRREIQEASRVRAPPRDVPFLLVLVVSWDEYMVEPVDLWRIRAVSASACFVAVCLLQQTRTFLMSDEDEVEVEGDDDYGGHVFA